MTFRFQLIVPRAVQEDIRALPDSWRMEALRALRAIASNAYYPDGYRHSILERQRLIGGDLSGLHSVAFGSASDYYASFRIVYRVVLTTVEVVAVGSRTGSVVFKTARDRIYPPPERERVRMSR